MSSLKLFVKLSTLVLSHGTRTFHEISIGSTLKMLNTPMIQKRIIAGAVQITV